jgi:FMN phosphatase YigB (HAD superfamily)
MKIIFDYNRTLFNPDTDSLYQGVVPLLESLSADHMIFLVSKKVAGRNDRLDTLNIKQYFQNIVFVDQKTKEVFQDIVGDETEVIVVGDRVQEEISIGNQLGFTTIWVRQGKFSTELPAESGMQPTHSIKTIDELSTIIPLYEK